MLFKLWILQNYIIFKSQLSQYCISYVYFENEYLHPSLNSSQINTPFPTHLTFYPSFFLAHQELYMLVIYVAFHWSMADSLGATTLMETNFPFPNIY